MDIIPYILLIPFFFVAILGYVLVFSFFSSRRKRVLEIVPEEKIQHVDITV